MENRIASLKASKAPKLHLVVCVAVALVLALSSFGSVSNSAFAADATTTGSSSSNYNSNITDARGAVIQINVYYTNSAGDEVLFQTGSGFLIDKQTVLTNYHVITSQFAGYEVSAIKVPVMLDLEIGASILGTATSEKADFAVLQLSQAINNRTVLPLGDAAAAQQTQSVFSLGFPGASSQEVFDRGTITTFTADDVTIGNGSIAKFQDLDGIPVIVHSATTSSGNSGGPLLDEYGNVLGINTGGFVDYTAAQSYPYALSIDFIKTTLDALGVGYEDGKLASTTGGSSKSTDPVAEEEPADLTALEAAISDAEKINFSNYTDESAKKFTDALSAAKSVAGDSAASQDKVDSATKALTSAKDALEQKQLPWLWIILGIVVVVVVAVVIITLVLYSKKKKKKAAASAGAAPAFAGGPQGQPAFKPATPAAPTFAPAPVASAQPAPVYQPPVAAAAPAAKPAPVAADNEGVGETTVLSPTIGETTLLGVKASLTRVSNSEKINITRKEFILGKERKKVTYVIPDNGAVSREHAKITQKDGEFYITDLNTTNFTFVNDKKIAPSTEVKLAAGDRIKLADEEFIFEK